jgi:hypothetical protein
MPLCATPCAVTLTVGYVDCWLTGRYDYEQLFDSVFEASGIWAEQMSYDTRFAQQRELEKTQMQVGEP